MKKRLLSAALALAMVLTMLPLSALPAFAATTSTPLLGSNWDDTNNKSVVSVTWRAENYQFQAANASKNIEAVLAPNDGWYYWGKLDGDTENKLYEATSGVINGTSTSGAWYPNVDKALGCGVSSMKLLGDASGDVTIKNAKSASLTIDLNGHDLTLGSVSLTQDNTDKALNDKLTSLTIKNSVKNSNDVWPTVSGNITATSQNFSYSATNTINTTGPTITVSNGSHVSTARTLSVTLTNAATDDLSVQEGAANIKVTASTKGAAKTGNITVNGTALTKNINYGSTSINVSGGKVGTIALNGKTGSGTSGINFSDMAEAGTITLYGGKKGDSGAASTSLPAWGGAITVTVGSQCEVASISEASGGSDGVITVNANTGSEVTGGIDLSKSATAHVVKVDGGEVGNSLKMNAGTLTIQNNANVAAVTLGAGTTGGKLTANITGGVIDGLAVSGSRIDPTVNISGGKFTKAVDLGSNYKKRTITGGTFTKSMVSESGWLSNVSYEILDKSGGNYTYTNSFQDCVNAYKISKDTNASGFKVTMVGSENADKKAIFTMGGQNETVVEIMSDGKIPIVLPSTVNNKKVSTWYVGGAQEPKDAGSPILLVDGETRISASETASDDSQLASVKVNYDPGNSNDRNPGLSAVLSGTTIKLSGALNSETVAGEAIELKFKTVLGTEYIATVAFYPELNNKTKQVLFVSATGAGNPIQAGRSSDTLMLKGNTTVYTLDGSGLVVSASVERLNTPGKTTASVSGVSLGTAEKAALEALLTNETTGLKADTNGATLVDSPAIQEAVNKIVAGLSQSQVDSYIRQGQIAQWKYEKNTTRTPNDSELSEVSDWKHLQVNVYLNVQVTAWNRQSVAQSMTLNITPYYSLVLSDTSGTLGTRVVKTGTALPMTGVTADYGSIEVSLPSGLVDPMEWAHHGDYVYNIAGGKFTTTHGFSPFVINGTLPNATRKDKNDAVVAYYDNVQTAIDETRYGSNDNDKVVLRDYYGKTAETYSISGKARTFTFDPGNNGTFVPTFSGANTTADKTNGNVWTVQLNADSVVNNASISVKTASNGSATINLTSVKPGASVSGTYTANSGYKAGAFTATAQPGNKSVTVNVAANGTFSFTVPADATSVAVTPVFVLDTGLPFTDVAASAWYFDGVKYCYNTTKNGYRVMEGFSSTQFGADRAYTRAEVVTILWNLKGRPTPGAATRTYTDVNSGHWAYNAIVWATNNGYAEGYPNGSFQPSSSVTREEMVVFLWRAAGKPATYNSINLNGYTDGYNVHDWGLSAMKWAVALNILSGQNSVSLNGTLAARTTAYRREVAVTIMNFDKLNLF